MKLKARIAGGENMRLVLRDKDGTILRDETFSNIITDIGKEVSIRRLFDLSAQDPFEYLALGSDNTAPTVGDTALGAEITTNGGDRALANKSITTTTSPNDTIQLDYEWTFSGTLAIEEIGIFNAASGGQMLARALPPAGTLNVTTGMKLQVFYLVDQQ